MAGRAVVQPLLALVCDLPGVAGNAGTVHRFAEADCAREVLLLVWYTDAPDILVMTHQTRFGVAGIFRLIRCMANCATEIFRVQTRKFLLSSNVCKVSSMVKDERRLNHAAMAT